MKQLTEEVFPYIKPEKNLKELDPKSLHAWLLPQEANEQKPAITRLGKVDRVVGEGDQRVLILGFLGNYLFMFNDEMPEELKSEPNDKLIGKEIRFKPVGMHGDKILVSYKAIAEYYKTAMERRKILSGKIVEIRESKVTRGKFAIVKSKGDRIIIPSDEFVYLNFLSDEERKGSIIDFVIVEVKPNMIIGSSRDVYDFRKEQLDGFFENKESFTAEVEATAKFGAYLSYKHDNELLLRNKDFSLNYTAAKDVLEKGDKVKVNIKEISPVSHNYMVELTNKYYVEPEIDLKDIEVGQQMEGEVVGISSFGCFVRIGVGRDVLCPVVNDLREPIIGDKVNIEIVVVNVERGRLRGKILGYKDEPLDLSAFDLF